jgi:hypothetical protein
METVIPDNVIHLNKQTFWLLKMTVFIHIITQDCVLKKLQAAHFTNVKKYKRSRRFMELKLSLSQHTHTHTHTRTRARTHYELFCCSLLN